MLWALRLEKSKPLWLRIVDSLLPSGLTFTYLLKSKPTKDMIDKYCPSLPQFYKDIVTVWRESQENVIIGSKEQIKDECIWLNAKIKANNRPMYNLNCIQKGILQIKDLLSNEGEIMSHTEINTKYNTKLTFLDSLQIRLTLQHDWKLILTDTLPENKASESMLK